MLTRKGCSLEPRNLNYLFQINSKGSRVGKHWFVVKDSSIKTERLLTLTPQSQGSPIEYDQSVRHVIMDLFLALQHPYIYPILDLEFIEANVQKKNANIIVVLPFNNKGSLKDLIYKVRKTSIIIYSNLKSHPTLFELLAFYHLLLRLVGMTNGQINTANAVKACRFLKYND